MATRVSVAQAKAELSALMAAVAYQGSARRHRAPRQAHGRASVDDLEQIDGERATSARPRGALALIGAWGDLNDREIEAMVADIYAAREQDTGRPVELAD